MVPEFWPFGFWFCATPKTWLSDSAIPSALPNKVSVQICCSPTPLSYVNFSTWRTISLAGRLNAPPHIAPAKGKLVSNFDTSCVLYGHSSMDEIAPRFCEESQHTDWWSSCVMFWDAGNTQRNGLRYMRACKAWNTGVEFWIFALLPHFLGDVGIVSAATWL
jgi:hypothetical protein